MALIIKDRVQESTTTTGTGAVSLGGAVTNFVAFSSVMANADTTYYAIISATDWEVGLGTYATSGNTLARTTVYASSNAGALVNFAAGTKFVYIDAVADRTLFKDANNTIASPTFSGTIAGTPSISSSSSLASQIVTVNLGTFSFTTAIGSGLVTNIFSYPATCSLGWTVPLPFAPPVGSQVTITGSTITSYNGTWTVITSSTTSIQFSGPNDGTSTVGNIVVGDWVPVFSQTFSVSISSTLWNAAGYVTGSAYGGNQPIVYAGNAGASIDALGDELEMDGLTVSASLGASTNLINVYVTTTNGGPVVGPRKNALQLY